MRFRIMLIILCLLQISLTVGQTTPEIEGDVDVEFFDEREQQILRWIIIDDNPKSYNISIIEDDSVSSQETILSTGFWESEQHNGTILEFPISVNVILEVGIYTFYVRVIDYDENSIIFSTTATVGDVDDIELYPGPGLPLSIHPVLSSLLLLVSIKFIKRRR